MKKDIINIIKITLMAAYFCIAIILIVEACMPGSVSANQSNKVGTIIMDKVQPDLGEKAEYVKPTSIEIENEGNTFYQGGTYQLKVKILPDNSSKKIVHYTSSNNSIVSISTNGYMTCHKEGTATIKAQVKDTDVYTTKEIQVVKPPKPSLSRIEVSGNLEEIVVGQAIEVRVSPVPGNATMGDVTWSTPNSDIIQIESPDSTKTKLTALKVGTATINVKTSTNKSQSFTIKVIEITKPVETIEITNKEEVIELIEGEKFKLEFTCSPSDATRKDIKYSKSNNLVDVSQDGTITAKQNGTSIVYVKYAFNNEVMDSIKIKIKSRPAVFNIKNETNEKDEIEIKIYSSIELIIDKESMPSSYTMEYSTSNENIAEISSSGTINAKQAGSTYLYVKCTSGDGAQVIRQVTLKIIDEYGANYNRFFLLVRKSIGHFLAFTVFAICGACFFLAYFKKKWIYLPVTLIVGFTIAGITELIQKIVPGRYGAFTDVMIDFSGYFVGTIVVFLVYGICILIRLLLKNIKGGIQNEKE